MKKNFILMMSALMIASCGGNKQQADVAGTETAVEATEVQADSEEPALMWGYVSVGNDQLGELEVKDREVFSQAQEFLMEVLCPGEEVDTYAEEWITAHCSPEIKQFLKDQYDFEGEGYAKWLFEGRFAGEAEYDTEVVGFGYGERRGKPVYAIEQRYTFGEEEPMTRNLYFGLEQKGDDFVITSFEINLEEKDPTVSFD